MSWQTACPRCGLHNINAYPHKYYVDKLTDKEIEVKDDTWVTGVIGIIAIAAGIGVLVFLANTFPVQDIFNLWPIAYLLIAFVAACLVGTLLHLIISPLGQEKREAEKEEHEKKIRVVTVYITNYYCTDCGKVWTVKK